MPVFSVVVCVDFTSSRVLAVILDIDKACRHIMTSLKVCLTLLFKFSKRLLALVIHLTDDLNTRSSFYMLFPI